MSNIKFEIDKARGDSFYHYKKHVDGRLETDKSGSSAKWGLYSNLTTEDEQNAWLDAVKEFNKNNGIETPCMQIKNELKKFKEMISADEAQFPEKQNYLMPALQAAVDTVGGATGICSDDYIDTLMKACGGALPTKENILKYTTEAFENNLAIDIEILKSSLMKLGVSAFVDPLVNSIEGIIDKYFGTIDLVYNEIARKYANVLQLYRSWTSDSLNKNKEEAKQKFIEALKQLPEKIQELLIFFITLDMFKKLVEMLKSIKTIGQNICNTVLSGFKNIKEAINSINFSSKQQLLSLLDVLLFALGGFLGAMFAARCSKEQEVKGAVDSLIASEGVKDEDELYDKVVNKDTKDYRDTLSSNTTIYKYACNNINNYSLIRTTQNPLVQNEPKVKNKKDSNNDITNCLCKVSMCETIDPTDTSDWTSWLERPNDVILEFDLRTNYTILVHVGDHVQLNQKIATINQIPVKSREDFIVTEIGKNYIIGKYGESEYDNLLDLSLTTEQVSIKAQDLIKKKIEEFSDNPYDKIIADYKKIAQAKIFIRDYISYYRFPEFAAYTKEYTGGNVTAISTDKFIELYEKKADKIKEDHQKDLKNACKKKNLKTYTDPGRMVELKEFLDSMNDACLNKILTLYNLNPGNMKYCSEGRIYDFMLYSHYIEYLYSDNFEYDEDNPYIVRLSDKLNYFIGRRIKLELNKDKLDDLIQSFNEACDKLLRVCWPFSDFNYYDKLSELFKYDTYTNTEVLAEGTPDDSISLYRRLEAYIRSLTKFTKTDEYADVDISTVSDYNKLLEEQSKDEERIVNKDQEEYEKALRKLTYRFVSLKRIELSLNELDLSVFYDESAYSKFENAKNKKGDIVYEYDKNKTYAVKDKLYGMKSSLDPYLNILKKLTDEEARELKEITDDAKKFYLQNNDRLNSCEDLFALGEINWPGKSIIYRKNEPKDYYLFAADTVKDTPKNFNDLKDLEAKLPPIDNVYSNELLNISCAPNTQYGIDNILYWLRYCAVATIANCMLPMFWGTGIIVPSKIPLPIIYIPIIPINVGPMIIVIGIGLCGMFPWPMIIFVNPSAVKASIIIPITLAVDMVTKLVQKIPEMQKPAIQTALSPLITSFDTEINNCIAEEKTVDYQIEQLKNVSTNYDISYKFDEAIGLDTTSKATKIKGELGGTLELHSNIEEIETQTIEYKTIDDLINAHEEALNQKHFAYNETPTGAK